METALSDTKSVTGEDAIFLIKIYYYVLDQIQTFKFKIQKFLCDLTKGVFISAFYSSVRKKASCVNTLLSSHFKFFFIFARRLRGNRELAQSP